MVGVGHSRDSESLTIDSDDEKGNGEFMSINDINHGNDSCDNEYDKGNLVVEKKFQWKQHCTKDGCKSYQKFFKSAEIIH